MCHPALVLLCDTIWTRLAARRFLYGESCLFFTLNLCTVYGGSMTQLIVIQGEEMWKSIRQRSSSRSLQ